MILASHHLFWLKTKLNIIMENTHKEGHCPIHLCLKIAKLVFQAAGVAAAFCMVHEIHKVHRSIEEKHEHKHIL